MDEKLIDELYNRAVSLGYKRNRSDFSSLIKADDEVYEDMFKYAQGKGLVSDANQFGTMVGRFQAPYKKKEEPELGLPGQMFQTKPQAKPEPQLRVSPTPVGRGARRMAAEPATELPSEAGLSVSQGIEQPLKPSVGIVAESTAVPKVDVKAIQKQKEVGDRESYWDNILNNLNLGANSFDKMIASIPETAINILATPGNAVAYLTGLDIATNADKIKEQFGIRNPVLDWLNEEGKIAQEKVAKFNKENYSTSGVAENIAKGNYSDAFELIGAGIAQSLPVSLTMMYGGATLTPAQLVGAGTFGFYGENAKELGEEDPNMPEIEKNLKALGMASAETVFSAIGTGTIGQVYRDLVKKEGADVAKNVLQSGLAQTYKKAIEKYGVPVGLVGEGIEEAATQITQNVISGKPAFQGAADAFLIGAGSGAAFTAPISGAKAVNYISDKIEKYDTKVKIENLVKEKGTTLDAMFNVPVADDITVDQVEVANMGKSRDLLLKSLETKMKNGDITEDDAKQSLYVFDKIQQVSNSVKDLDVTAEDKATIASLLKKRDDIKVKMQNKDDVLLGREKQQVAEINKQINDIITKPKEDAVQIETAGQVPVQPRAGVSQEMAEGITEAGPEVAAAEGVTAKAEVAPTLTEEKVKSLDRNNIIELAKLSGVESNWDMVGEGDWLSGKKGEDAYVQRMLPIWNRARKLGNINPDSEITYRAKDDYVEAVDENGVAVGIIQMGSNGGILHLAVAPEFRGKGISKNLYTELKKNNPNANLSKTKNRSIGFEKSLGAIAISEAYNRSKQDGSNPELVKAVEDLLPTEAPVVKAQVEEPITKEYNNITIYNRAGKKININLNDLTVKKDVDASAKSKWDRYNIEVGGNVLGYIETKEKGDDIQIALSGIFDPFESNFKYDGPLEPIIKMIINALDKIFPKRNYKNIAIKTNKGKGIGSKAYGLLAKEINNKLGKKLISDTTRSDAAEALWKSLEKKGLARVVGNRDGQRWAYYYEYIVPEAKEEVEKFADTKAVENLLPTEAPVVKAQVEMVQFPTATTTLETEGTGVITEGVEPVFKGSNAPTVNLSTDTQERYAEDYTADEIETSEHAPSSRVVSVASNLGTGQVTYTKQGEKKTFSLPFINTESTKKIQGLREKYKAVKGSSKSAKEEKAKLKAEINAESKKVLSDFKNTMVQNLLALYDSLTPEFVAKSKQWYVGANRMAQALAQKYNISIDQVGGIIAALSPQNDWFNNVSVAERAIEVMTKYADTKLTKAIVDKAVAYNTDSSGERNSFAQDILDLFNQYGEVSINELQSQGLSPESQSAILRAFDQALHSPKVAMTDPEGKFVGFDKTPVRWNSNTEIAKAISIFRNGSIENINSELGGGNKVRNFYNNIVDPDSETPYLTADTHALSAALNSPISANDAGGIGLFNGGAEPLYALVKAAYIDAARIAGIKPREMQSITWEAQRIGINDKSRTEDKKNETFQYITESRTNNQTPYERATELIARNRSANPSWGAGAGIETQKSSDAIREGAKLRAEQRAREISALRGPAGERVGATPAAVGGAVAGGTGVTETVKAQLGVPLSNQTLMEEIESRAAKDERVKAIITAAKKAITTLKSIIPSAQIYLHEDAEAYKSFAQSLGIARDSKGLFSIRKDADGNNIIKIHINLSLATPSTVYHEVAHAIMYKAFGDNKKVFAKFRDQISSVLDKSDVEALNNFASLYKNESRAEEWLVQLSALMTDQGKNIPISTFQRIADIVNKLVSQLTKGKIVPFKESVSKKEVIDFFNQMIDSLRAGKEISISKTAEAAEIKEVSKAEVSQPVNELPGYDKLMDDVTNTLIPNALRRKLTGEEMIKMVKKFVSKSDIYKAADDIQRDELVRQVNGMLGEAYRNPPSAQRLLGLIQDPVRITMTEKQLFAKQIMDQARAAKNVVKVWMKTSQEMAAQLKKMAGAGRITPSQASAIIRRMSFVNMLDENSVNSFVDYVAKVFKNAEYAQQIANVRRLLRNAKRNAETKIGVANELKPLLRQVFAINPSLIPDNVFEKYAKLVEMMGERAAVLTLEDAADVRKTASEIMDAVNAELSLVDTLADVFNNYQDKVLDDDGKVMYSDTINKMVDAGKITTSDAEILRKYKSVVMPAEPATPMTEQQIADEKRQLEDFVMDSEIDETNLPSRDERDDARKLNELIKTAGVGSLTNTELKNLLKVIANINNGYFPHYAKIMIEKIEGANSDKRVVKFLETAKPLRISEVYSRVKKLVVRGKDAISLMVERNPIQYIEQIFGDFKTNTLKEALFDPIAKAFSNYESDYNKILNKIRDVENSLSKQFKKDGNKITMSKYKMMTYMLQLENDSNPGSKEVAPAMKFLNETIKEINTGKTNFTERDAEMLQEIATKFNDGAGNIDINKLYNSFSNTEKSAIKELQSINASLSDKAAYTANVIRGQKFTPLNNYIHHSVISKSSPTADATGASLVDQFNASRMPSTRAKSLLERTAGAKPISFDVLDAVSFAAKGQLIDYHLTSVIRTGRRAIDAATKAALEMGKDKRDIMNAIAGAYERAIETVLVNSYVKSTFADDVMRIMSRQGYRAVLAGTSRFISELVSNISFVMWAGRAYFIEGVSLKDIVMSADGSTIMRNLKSKMTNRVYSSDTQSGNFIDRNIMKQAVGVSGSRAKSDVANKVNQIYSNTVKRASNLVETTADTLISTPDKIVMRPAWFGAFSIKFQELTGSKPDFEKIASNDEAYMVENQEALDQATSFADMKTTFIGATDNPFMGILKGTATRDQSAYAKVFNNFNGYMTRFLIYEYATTRTAINAMVGNGQLSKSEGAALMAGVTTRMIVYSFLINAMGTGLMGMLLGDDDDEEETEKTLGQKFGQALSSAAVGLVLGRDFGNVTKNMVNYGVEKFNKEYLDFLRNGDYDPYKDAIAFSIIGNEKEGQKSDVAKTLLNTTGALAPSLKTAYFVLDRLARPEPKGEEAKERRAKEFGIRLPLEVLGNLGMVPLYKDVRKVVLEEIYKDMGKKSRESKIKEDIKALLLQGYPSIEAMRRYDKELYEQTYGDGGLEDMMLPADAIKKEIDKEMKRLKLEMMDEVFDYIPEKKGKKNSFSVEPFGGKPKKIKKFGE